MGSPLLLAAAAATQNLSIFDPASPNAEAIRKLSVLVLAITGGIFVVVEGILLYSTYRFRRRSDTSPSEPPQVYGSRPIEIAWTAAPALIVFVLILVIARTEWEVRTNPDRPPEGAHPLEVTVIGHQWWWEFIYDRYDGEELGVITANELHIPASNLSDPRERRPVYLHLLSADVAHSFWVPRLAGKTDLIPGKPNEMSFETEQTGLFVGQCAEYCGTQHAHMLLRVEVHPHNEFARWLANQKKDAREDGSPEVRRGKDVFLGQTCVSCHRVRGTPAQGTYAPDLTHMMSRRTLASGMIANNPENLRRWVANPQEIKQGCLMAPFADLGERNLDLLVRYLLSLE
jgi:cytochrome c oxidase subunit 2